MIRNLLIVAAALLLMGEGVYMAFNGLFIKPDKMLTVKFESVPPMIKFAGDFGVYYRGYKVGKAVCQNLSEDQKHIVFCLEINYKDLKLPKNTQIILKTQDIFGDRYFDLVSPEEPSQEMLADGDVVEGRSVAVYERVDKYLVEQMEKGELGELISNMNYLAGGARGVISKEITPLITNPEFKKDIKVAIAKTPETIQKINRLLVRTVNGLEEVSQGLPEVNENIAEANIYLPGINDSLYTTDYLLYGTNYQLGCLNPKIPVIPQEVIWQADKTLKRYDCIGGALSNTMSKNCLFFRFLFGRPGEPFKDCICK